MTYEAWRISYQHSEQAARAAYAYGQELEAQISREKLACEAVVKHLEAQLVAEAARTAEQKLRADQLEQQHAMQAKMHAQANARIAELEAQMEAIGAGGVEPLRKPVHALPNGWVPCVITHDGQHPEEIAYGPQIMMERLKKWLDRYFEMRTHPTPQGLEQAIRALPRVSYGYKSDGESRYLQSYVSDDGPFLRHADVMAALAAQAKQGGV